MSIKPTYKVITLVVMVMFGILAFAQADLGLMNQSKAKETEYQPPNINKLTTNWWTQAIKAAPVDQPYFHLKQWSEQLLNQAQTESIELNADESQAISQFNINILNLTQSDAIKETKAPSTFEQQDSYNLKEVLDHMQQLRQMKQLLDEENASIEMLRNDANQQRQRIDQLIIEYQQYESNQAERSQLGYQWLVSRSWEAVYESQVNQFSSQIEQTQYQIDALDAHIQTMQQALTADVSDIDKLNKQITINQEALATAQQESLNSSLNIAKTSDTLNSSMIDFNKLNLAQSLVSQKRLELAIARDQAHKHWIATSIKDAVELDRPTKQLEQEVAKLLLDTREKINQWRTLAQDVLLSSVVNNSSSDSSVKKAEFSQEVLLKLDALDWQIDKVTFINSLISNQLEKPQSGFGRFAASIAEFTSSITTTFYAVVNKPLFRINETPVTLLPLLRLIIIVLVGYLVSKLVRLVIKRMESRRGNDKSPVFFMLDKLIHYIIIFVATLAGFTTLGIDFSNLTLIAGALSVGIGFGLQNIVSNFVSGLTIMFERTLKVGDYIEIEDGITGTVKEINARSTRINTNDNIDVVIPNSDLVTNQIINWTLRDSIKRVKIPFGVAYGSDKDLVRKAAQEAAEKVPYTLTNMNGKEPEVWMTGFGDNSLDFVLLIWVSKYGVRRPNRIKAAYLWELDTAFNQYGIEVPFPQRVLHHADDKTDLPNDLLETTTDSKK